MDIHCRFILVLLTVSSLSLCYCQSLKHELRIYSVTEYIDGFVITGISLNNQDTVRIASIKENAKTTNSGFREIIVGNTYQFDISDISENMAAIPSESFTIRLRNTVIWSHRDGSKKMPVFARNVKDLFIKE